MTHGNTEYKGTKSLWKLQFLFHEGVGVCIFQLVLFLVNIKYECFAIPLVSKLYLTGQDVKCLTISKMMDLSVTFRNQLYTQSQLHCNYV